MRINSVIRGSVVQVFCILCVVASTAWSDEVPRRVLLIEEAENRERSEFLADSLRKHQLSVDVQPSDQLFDSLNELKRYACVILVGVPRDGGIASVAGVVSGVTWEDGTTWPAWTGPAPQQEGDAAVSLVMKGLVGEGGFSLPLIGCFNHSNRKIQRLMYRIVFLDAAGNELLNKRWGAGSVDAGQGAAFIGFEGPPKGAAKVKLSLLEATFENSPGAATYSPLTAAQIGSRKEVSGGNWTVSFEEELYLGFAVQTSKDGKSSQQFYWSAKPSRSHKFHYDHQEKGGDHEVTFSPAGDGPSGITSRFSDPPISINQILQISDLEIRPAGGRIGRLVRGRQVRGPDTLYSMRGLGSEPVFILRIVFTNDTAAAEQALREVYDQ